MPNELVLEVNGVTVAARERDRYVPATPLCQAAKKKWNNYWVNKGTRTFLDALSSETGIPASALVQVSKGCGKEQGTWVHPRVVIHFAQWVNPTFAAKVTGWVLELLTTGEVKLNPVEAISRDLALVMERQDERLRSLEKILASGQRSNNIGPLWTVQDILHEAGWHTTSSRQRASIRDRANKVIRVQMGQEVEQLNGWSQYTRAQLPFVDRAIHIERLKAQVEEAERGLGLFDGLSDAA